MSLTEGEVRLERAGPVARLTFRRPSARNAMTMVMYEQLDRHLARLAHDAAHPPGGEDVDVGEMPVRVVVLRGADGYFVAGTDIAHFTSFRGADDGVRYERAMETTVARLESLPVPTVAAVEGGAVGGGLILAAACDVRLCDADAQFGMPIARTVGHCLSLANLARLRAHFGEARTKAMLLLADFVDAAEARACGFVREVVPAGQMDERVDAVCARLVEHAPLTLRVTKEALRRIAAARGSEVEDEDLLRVAYGSRDFHEGVRAFLDKSRADWEGR